MPLYAQYDYVEVWDYVTPEQYSATPGANQWHPFEFKWKDDFDSFDETRWIATDN